MHRLPLLTALLFTAACSSTPTLAIDRDDVAGRLTIRADDHEILGWRYGRELAIPHWFPLRSPSGKDLAIEHPDPYPHHTAMWIADKIQLGDGPVVDFYHCTQNQIDAKDAHQGYRHSIRQVGMPVCKVEGDVATFVVDLQWLIAGKPALDDHRVTCVRALPDGEALVDLEWTLRAAHGPVTFHSDAVHYAWPYIRVHPQFSAEHGGTLVDDAGHRQQSGTHDRYASWMDYGNEVDGAREGVAIFLPQDGEWHRWLTRDYGCFGPRRPDGRSGGTFALADGEELHGAVRLYVHRSDAISGNVAARYRDYVDGR